MKEIVDEVERWRQRGEKVAVATVVATRMSAPRPVGAKFAVSESGAICGSVSGRLRRERRRRAGTRSARDGRAEAAQLRDLRRGAFGVGLPCGGEIDVFVERFE